MPSGVFLQGLEYPASGVVRPAPGSPMLEEGLRSTLGYWLDVTYVAASRGLDSYPTTDGPLTSNRPLDIRSLPQTGAFQTSFTEDWYNRLHVYPGTLDYGAVGSETARPVTLWNAYLSTTTLSDIDVTNPTGIQIGGPSVPRNLLPLEYVRHSIIAKVDGPPTINSTLIYRTNRGEPIVPLVGTRANLWPFFPNWRESVQVELSHRTDIITSRSGREQRRALRNAPRKSLSYTLTVNENRLRAFNRAMAKWQNRPVVMGDPTRGVGVTVTAGNASTTVYPVPEWLVEGANVVLDERQMLTVDSVGPLGDVVFRTPADSDGYTLRPALTGQLAGSLSGEQQTDGVMEVSVQFDVMPGSEAANVGEPEVDLLNGREVFARRFNWANGQDVTYGWPTETLDFGFGRTSITRPVQFGTVTRKAVFVQQGAGDMVALEQFYQRQKGQRGEFYMPTGTDDLPLGRLIVAGTVNVVIGGRETFDAYEGDTVHRAIGIYLRDGRRIYRGLSGMYLDGGDTVLQCDRSFLVDIAVGEVSRVSWLTVSRLASDQFTQEWLTSTVAQTQLAVSTLEALPVERPIADYDGAAQWVLENWGAETGLLAMGSLDYLVNIAYPAVWYIPEAWVYWESTQQGLAGLDYVVNYRMPEVFPD